MYWYENHVGDRERINFPFFYFWLSFSWREMSSSVCFRHSGFTLPLWRAGVLWWTQERCLATVSHWMTSLHFLGEQTDSFIQDGLVHGFETSMELPVHDGLMMAHGWSWIQPYSGHFGELILASTFLSFLHP